MGLIDLILFSFYMSIFILVEFNLFKISFFQ